MSLCMSLSLCVASVWLCLYVCYAHTYMYLEGFAIAADLCELRFLISVSLPPIPSYNGNTQAVTNLQLKQRRYSVTDP